jgi:hypothetical protein
MWITGRQSLSPLVQDVLAQVRDQLATLVFMSSIANLQNGALVHATIARSK